jgi:uncharacterized membrane protein
MKRRRRNSPATDRSIPGIFSKIPASHPHNLSMYSLYPAAATLQERSMASFLVVCGLIFAVLVSPLYIFMMRWLGGWQRVYIFVLIGGVMVASSFQLSQMLPAHLRPDDLLLYNFRTLSFFALTIGWFVCGFFHAVISLCRAWGSEQAPQATPEPVQD